MGRYYDRGGSGLLARFSDICRRCGGDIAPGQRVVPSKGHYIHTSCASGADDD